MQFYNENLEYDNENRIIPSFDKSILKSLSPKIPLLEIVDGFMSDFEHILSNVLKRDFKKNVNLSLVVYI
jgi:hypothetical protein